MAYLSSNKYISSSFFVINNDARLPVFLGFVGIILGFSYLIQPWQLFLFSLISSVILGSIFLRPESGYYLVLLLMPVDMTQIYIKLEGTEYMYMIFPYEIVLTATIIVWICYVMAGLRTRGLPTPINNVLLILVFYELASIVWSPTYTMGLLLGASLILHFIFLHLTLSLIRDEQSMKKAINVMIVMGVIMASGVVVSQWESYKESINFTSNSGVVFMFGEFHDRPAGLGTVDNMAGLLCMLSFIVAGKMLIQKRGPWKLFYMIILAYFVVAMVLTTCRGALIGFVAGAGLLILIHPLTSGKVIRNSTISVILLVLTIFIAKPAFIDRLLVGFGYTGTLYFSSQKSSHSSNYDESEQGISGMDQRFYWWETALNEMIKHPGKLLFGLGIGGFIQHAECIGTHSVPLSFFYDMGLIGLILLVLFLSVLIPEFYFYYKKAAVTDNYYIYIAVLVGFVAEVGIHGLIDYDFFSYTARMFWFPLALVLAALNVVKRENMELSEVKHA